MSIYWSEPKQKWHARRYELGKNHHIGYYETIGEAQDAVDDWISPESKKKAIDGRFNDIIDFEGATFVPPKVHDPFRGKSVKWFREQSQAQIKSLSLKHGPKVRE